MTGPPPTPTELKLAADRASFATTAKYPLRENAVPSEEQLAAARAQLGKGAFVPGKAAPRDDVDRYPLTTEQLRAARAEVGMVSRRGG